VNPSSFWQGRERYTVFDMRYGDGSQVAALIDAWRRDPMRPARLHIVALTEGLLPGFHRVPQVDDAIKLELLFAPLDAALSQLSARIDFVRLDGMQGDRKSTRLNSIHIQKFRMLTPARNKLKHDILIQ